MAGILLLVSGCGINNIPTQKQQVDAAWSQVLNEYQRRTDLIPNLVATVKGYAAHEADVLEAVNEMNQQIRVARAYWDGRGVILTTEVLAEHLDGDDFWERLLAMTSLAELYSPRLQERFGGQVPFGPALPAKDQTQGSGGYL